MSDAIRVLLVDDHSVVREGLRAFLHLQPDISVVGEAADGRSGAQLAAEVLPDVVILDLVMPAGDGLEALRTIRAHTPDARVLVLTSFTDDVELFAAMDAGAAGYLLKDLDPEALAAAIREVHAGRPALHPLVATRLMRRAAEPSPAAAGLTARERDVLRLIVEGLPNKEIASRLRIGEKTVKTHVSRILGKLGVTDRTQAAVLAIRSRLVE